MYVLGKLTLYVIIERQILVPIFFQQPERIVIGEVFKLYKRTLSKPEIIKEAQFNSTFCSNCNFFLLGQVSKPFFFNFLNTQITMETVQDCP